MKYHMKYPIIGVTLSLLFSTAWADGVDCEKSPYYGVCPNCESSTSEDDSTAPVGSAHSAGAESASPYVGTGLAKAPAQAVQDGNEGSAAQATDPVTGGPYRSDYLDGGYFGGRTD